MAIAKLEGILQVTPVAGIFEFSVNGIAFLWLIVTDEHEIPGHPDYQTKKEHWFGSQHLKDLGALLKGTGDLSVETLALETANPLPASFIEKLETVESWTREVDLIAKTTLDEDDWTQGQLVQTDPEEPAFVLEISHEPQNILVYMVPRARPQSPERLGTIAWFSNANFPAFALEGTMTFTRATIPNKPEWFYFIAEPAEDS